MTLTAAFNRHHTAWIHCDSCPPHPFRYAVDGDRLVCFGDEFPGAAVDGRRVLVTVHEIAGGPALSEFNGTLCDVSADTLDANTVLDLLDHVALGRDPVERDAAIARHRLRRLVAVTDSSGCA